MPFHISCGQNHATRSISAHEAAIALAEGRPLGACKKCGKDLEYNFEQTLAGAPRGEEYAFVVTRVLRLGTRPDMEPYDAFLLILRDVETGKQRVLPAGWFEGQGNTARTGHLGPLLTLAEWKSLFSQLDASFHSLEERIRMRAYQLYEQRGKRNGGAVQDWLQAESEMMGSQEFRSAA